MIRFGESAQGPREITTEFPASTKVAEALPVESGTYLALARVQFIQQGGIDEVNNTRQMNPAAVTCSLTESGNGIDIVESSPPTSTGPIGADSFVVSYPVDYRTGVTLMGTVSRQRDMVFGVKCSRTNLGTTSHAYARVSSITLIPVANFASATLPVILDTPPGDLP